MNSANLTWGWGDMPSRCALGTAFIIFDPSQTIGQNYRKNLYILWLLIQWNSTYTLSQHLRCPRCLPLDVCCSLFVWAASSFTMYLVKLGEIGRRKVRYQYCRNFCGRLVVFGSLCHFLFIFKF